MLAIPDFNAGRYVITPHSIHVHFSFILVAVVFEDIYQVLLRWSFLKPHKPCRNADVPSKARQQFLQEFCVSARFMQAASVADRELSRKLSLRFSLIPLRVLPVPDYAVVAADGAVPENFFRVLSETRQNGAGTCF